MDKELELLAHQIATEAHKGQTDKSGKPYIGHVERVANRCHTPEAKIVALLHDVIEDTEVTADELRQKGIPENIVQALLTITRTYGEPYETSIHSLSPNPLCREVKIADLEDNMDIRRLNELTDKDVRRLRKYLNAWQLLCTK